jgi:hypothetical protein
VFYQKVFITTLSAAMTLPIAVNLVNFCLLLIRSAEMLVRLAMKLYQTIVSVTALQNNEMPIGVDHS